MSVKVSRSDRTLSVIVSGKLDSMTAPELDAVVDQITSDLSRVEFDFSELLYISSIGLRRILQIRKALNRDAVIDIAGVSEVVAEIFRTTGFDSYVVLHEAKHVTSLSIKDLFSAFKLQLYKRRACFSVADRGHHAYLRG